MNEVIEAYKWPTWLYKPCSSSSDQVECFIKTGSPQTATVHFEAGATYEVRMLELVKVVIACLQMPRDPSF